MRIRKGWIHTVAFIKSFNLCLELIPPRCLQLAAGGVKVTQTSGYVGNSLSFNIKFFPNAAGAWANFTGVTIYPPGSATCSVMGNGAAASNNFVFKLEPFVMYSVDCQIVSNFSDIGSTRNVTDVKISNSVSGVFSGLLYHASPLAQKFEDLYQRVEEGLRAVHNLTKILADVSYCFHLPA